jgi:hypothetical protein
MIILKFILILFILFPSVIPAQTWTPEFYEFLETNSIHENINKNSEYDFSYFIGAKDGNKKDSILINNYQLAIPSIETDSINKALFRSVVQFVDEAFEKSGKDYTKDFFTTEINGKLLKGYTYLNVVYTVTIIGREWYFNGKGDAGTSFLITLEPNN